MARPFLRLLPIVVLSGLVVLAPRTPSHAEAEPPILLTPSSGPAGTSVSVSGVFRGCSVSSAFQVLWDDQVVDQGDSVAGPGGFRYFGNFTVPAGASFGVHRVQVPVKTAPCWRTLTAPFTVTSGMTPTVTPSPSVTPPATSTPLPLAGPPRAAWVLPDDGALFPGPIQLAARVAPARVGGQPITTVRFIGTFEDGGSIVACTVPQPDGDGVYGCTWDPASAGLSGGQIQVSIEVWDQIGQVSRNVGGSRTVSYQPPAPADAPAPAATPVSAPTPTATPEPMPSDIPIWTMTGMEAGRWLPLSLTPPRQGGGDYRPSYE